jgi:AAA+ superfamily predicted ATPase
MPQSDFIKDIARYGLENDQENLLKSLNGLIEYFKQHKKVNFAIQLQSLLRDALRYQDAPGMVKVGSPKHILRESDKEYDEFIIEKLTSDYTFDNLVCSENVHKELTLFIQEHKNLKLLNQYDLPISNKVIFHGPSGCGKTLAAYVLAGELQKMMVVINLGAIVSPKLGETSKNLAKIFRKAAGEESIIFIDEFDSLGKIRDYSQDHGEMKRVVNTILQLFDYLPQSSLVIAATNQIEMIDDALLRRFDLNLKLDLPDDKHIKEIIDKTLHNNKFKFDVPSKLSSLIKSCRGLSYYTIQKTLINAIKRSLFHNKNKTVSPKINTTVWSGLIKKEKAAIRKKR